MIHDQERVEAIRDRVAAEQPVISDLEDLIKDPVMLEYLGKARNYLGDAGSMLGSLTEKSLTANDEAHLLYNAELMLQLAAVYLKFVQDMLAKYGPDVRTIG